MRCEVCRTTGYTEAELDAHISDTGHNPGPSSSLLEEFPRPKNVQQLTAEEEQEFAAFLSWRRNRAAKGADPNDPSAGGVPFDRSSIAGSSGKPASTKKNGKTGDA